MQYSFLYLIYTFLSPLHCGFHRHKGNEVSSHEDHHDLGYPKSNEDFALLVLLFWGLNVLIHLIYLVSEIVKIFKYSIAIKYSNIWNIQHVPNFYLFLVSSSAAAKLLHSCPTLCDPIDSSPPGSPVPGILQARTLEWAAISFSNAWKWKVKVKLLQSCLTLSDPMDCSLPGSCIHGILQAKSTGVGWHFLLYV